MIPCRRKSRPTLTPRLPGFAPAWSPAAPVSVAVEAGEFALGRARVQAATLPLPGTPTLGDAAGCEMQYARTYPVGWFDLQNIWEAVPAFREAEEDAESSAAPAGSLSPEDEFLRRLAARLQPPLSHLTAPNGVLEWPAPLLPYQQEGVAALLSRPALLLADDMGLGKAQPLAAKILTPYGWSRMGDMQIGMEVVGSDGLPARVVGVYPQGEKNIYRVTFSDGAQTECCEEHLWQVKTPNARKRGGQAKVLSLCTLRKGLRNKQGNCQYFVPLCAPVKFQEAESSLPLAPYLLGALIGDGGIKHRVMFSTADDEMVSRLRALLPNGVDLKHHGNAYDWQITGAGRGKPNRVTHALRELGLMGKGSAEKFVPDCYKFASAETRLAMLQGLMDTDGWVTKDGHVGFSSVSKQLADDVSFLVQSFGGTARRGIKYPKGGLPSFWVTIALPSGIVPFALARKAEAYRPRQKYPPARAIVDVEHVGRKEAQCIRIDAANHLYITDDFLVTHNTIQSIAALRILFFQQRIASALIVCPASLLAQWRRELAKWGGDLQAVTIAGTAGERSGLWRVPAHVRVVSYETLRMDVVEIADSPAARETWDVVVLDEASRIKNRESGNAIACKRLRRVRRWALTGTPLENSLDDIVSLLEFLNGEPGQPYAATSLPAETVAQLRQVQLRRKKEDVLRDLPPKQIIELKLDLPPAQRAAYDRAEKEGVLRLAQYGADLSITHVLELITRLKQICNVDPAGGESAKFRDIAQRMETLTQEGHRALIFSQFTDDTFGVGRLAQVLRAYRPLEFTGSLSPARRALVVQRFMSDPTYRVLLLSLRAGGVGAKPAGRVLRLHLDRWWNPAIEEQADSRAHRMGQPYPVTIFRYICAGTIEERIDETLKAKRKLFTDLIDDVSLDITHTLSAEELFQLFRLAPPRSSQDRRRTE